MKNALKFARKKAAGVLLISLLMSSAAMYCQSEGPIPVMTGSVGYFTKVTEGQKQITALNDQLGLKLVKTKGPRGFLVIDAIERPTPDGPFVLVHVPTRARGAGARGR